MHTIKDTILRKHCSLLYPKETRIMSWFRLSVILTNFKSLEQLSLVNHYKESDILLYQKSLTGFHGSQVCKHRSCWIWREPSCISWMIKSLKMIVSPYQTAYRMCLRVEREHGYVFERFMKGVKWRSITNLDSIEDVSHIPSSLAH